MAELRLAVEIVEFDLTHVRVKVSVLGKRQSDKTEAATTKKLYQPSASTLRMTLIELHIFLRALLEFKGPLEVTTPDLLRDELPKGQGEDKTDYEIPSSFLSDEPFFEGSSEAAE